ncbi:MAG TPA: endopeptidase La [Armatimonadota bacterium]|nr:endopeptidase La [Armatimonadota bacterium]
MEEVWNGLRWDLAAMNDGSGPDFTGDPLAGEGEISIPREIPLLPVRDTVVFPRTISPLSVGKPRSVQLINDALESDKIIGLFAISTDAEEPTPDDIYPIGSAAGIAKMLRAPDGTLRLIVQGLQRIRLLEIVQDDPYYRARVEVIPEIVPAEDIELEGTMRHVLALFERVVNLAPYLPDDLLVFANSVRNPGHLADIIASTLNLKLNERQELLELNEVGPRLRRLTELLNREIEILEIGSRIQESVKTEMEKTQREYVLREQMKAIQRELGEMEGGLRPEVQDLREKLKAAPLSEEARQVATREVERLDSINPASPEYTVARTYVEWILELPWEKSSEDRLDILEAQRILNEDHYDLERVKDRILEYLAVRKLKADMKGPILCFVGPPGVGKTSLGQSIARAMQRQFIRISLGSVRDEAEIRGHRRTYVGALPGRIIQGIRRAGTNNPVFMLDEVDKLGMDFRGDPSAALLEVLDPAQNFAFSDHYLEIPFDLSTVLFICTANMLEPIPPALQDRMEIISLAGYTEVEKLEIAKRYLVPRQRRENGLPEDKPHFPPDTLKAIITAYTREAGVRNLEREIGTVCRKVARRYAEGKPIAARVRPSQLAGFLGPRRFRHQLAEEQDEVGVATALAYTPVGGETMPIEVSLIPGRGELILTGSLGDVMKESARAALTYARSRAQALGLEEEFYKKYDLHIHVPAGATPKDGPSAGITIATAVISALTGVPVRKDVGMTGEITLRGHVLPIGGLRDKLVAAHRAGLRRVLIPRDNEADLAEVHDFVKRDLEIIPLAHMDDVLPLAFVRPLSADGPRITATGDGAGPSGAQQAAPPGEWNEEEVRK